jgi:hypothetical protein
MKRFAMVLAVIAADMGSATADSWSYSPTLQSTSYEFGNSRFVLEIDGRKDQAFPPHTLSIYLRGKLVAKYQNVAFDKIYASKDNRFFVGLSNGGIPGTAFVLFDSQGKLIREVKHRFLPKGIHTDGSVTLSRIWFNEKEPAVEFKAEGDYLEGVFVRGSSGQRYNLLEPDLGFDPSKMPGKR